MSRQALPRCVKWRNALQSDVLAGQQGLSAQQTAVRWKKQAAALETGTRRQYAKRPVGYGFFEPH